MTSFDRQTQLPVRLQRPRSAAELEALPADCLRVPRGAGVSYVAASFGHGVVSQSMLAFDRLLGFDATTGVLDVEAGVSIAAVQRFALAQGWYLPVAPGHPRASIGGCIAANVHGKNPARDGCFAAVTGRMRLFHPQLGWRDAVVGDALWRATLGGFGMTGCIVTAQLQLQPAYARVGLQQHKVGNLSEAATLMRDNASAMLLYGWHDGRPAHFGAGLIRIGHAEGEASASRMPRVRLPARMPVLPVRLWYRPTLAVANTVLRARWQGNPSMTLGDALLPLNGAAPYFAAYGLRGMLESQWLLPHDRFDEFAAQLEVQVRRLCPLIPLISSKLFAGQSDGPAFDGKGISLALHVPADRRGQAFLGVLTELALAHQGRPNPVKQSGLSAEVLRHALPQLGDWQVRVAAHDPGQMQYSELGSRLGLR